MATKWRYKAEYFEFCNCHYGCPCNFNGFPDKGNCQAVVGYRILEGKCGDTNLAGSTVVLAVKWPKAIHDGNGTAAVFFDPTTTEAQQQALAAIFTNQYGGLPHEIIAGTITGILGPFVEPIDIKSDGTRSSLRIGSKVSAEMTPHVSPVDPKEEQEVHVVMPTGFIFKDAKAARNVGQSVNVDALKFSDQNSSAFYTVVEHSN